MLFPALPRTAIIELDILYKLEMVLERIVILIGSQISVISVH